ELGEEHTSARGRSRLVPDLHGSGKVPGDEKVPRLVDHDSGGIDLAAFRRLEDSHPEGFGAWHSVAVLVAILFEVLRRRLHLSHARAEALPVLLADLCPRLAVPDVLRALLARVARVALACDARAAIVNLSVAVVVEAVPAHLLRWSALPFARPKQAVLA